MISSTKFQRGPVRAGIEFGVRPLASIFVVSLLGLFGLGCGEDSGPPAATGEELSPHACVRATTPSTTAACVESFEPGEDAGFGADRFPEIIYGDPLGNGDTSGGLDVLSLGRGGSLVIGFGTSHIVDGEGPDFVVFENAFFAGGNPDEVYAELGEVAVSSDGVDWKVFPCMQDAKPWEGCAGKTPVYANGDLGISAYDPAVSGGDVFDLKTIGVTEARFVRIRDLSEKGGAPSAGFDLDAIAVLHSDAP